MHPSPVAIARAQALAGAALALEGGAALSPPPGADVEVADLFAAVMRHRVAELLYAQRDGLGLPAEFGTGLVDALAAVHSDARRRVAIQLLEIGRLLELFAGAEVPVLVLKGPALALQSAGDVVARGYGDIDLFIAPESVETAHVVLAEHGWEPRRWGSAIPGSWAWRHLIATRTAWAWRYLVVTPTRWVWR